MIKKIWAKIYAFIDKHFFTPPNDKDYKWHQTNLKIPAGQTKVVFDITGLMAWEWKNEIIVVEKEGVALAGKLVQKKKQALSSALQN